ncbi:GGDEF domain-containing protein [Arenimonas oryziterrae]|uniref:GGDEF domain-containing protein n=1 Tax=Arenimonas oryziterrae TaxID=498055 RepID=UPI000409108F|nr:GGDEF domain-containing protein [Arenimonas oryziterrae]
MTDARPPIQPSTFAAWSWAVVLVLLLAANTAWAAQRQLDRPPPPPPGSPVESGRPPPPPPPGGWNTAPPPEQTPPAQITPPAPVAVEPAAPDASPVVAGSVADLENKLADARRSNNTADISAALIRLADAQLQAGQASRALPLLEEAVTLSSRYNDDRQGREAALLMAKAYLAQDDAGMADTWNKRAEQFRERIERQIAPRPEASGDATATPATGAPAVVAPPTNGVDGAEQPAAAPSQARWLWLLLPVCLLLIWAWLRSQRKADDLRNETERLARHQKHLRNAHQTLQQQAEHLRQTATQDALTGALTRQAFANDLSELLHHAQHYGKPVAFFLFDLDHFKSVNDTYGHLAGDIALKMVAGVVRENLDSQDLFGRFGGDEFLIACMDGDAATAPLLAEKIRASVRKHAVDGHESLHDISISVGIAIADPEQGYDLATLFTHADTALYAAKRAGRNCVRLADAGLATPPSSEFPLRSLAATPNDA